MRRFLEFMPYYAVGVILGFTISSVLRQTELLENLTSLVYEQRRMLLAASKRAMEDAAAASSPTKETASDA